MLARVLSPRLSTVAVIFPAFITTVIPLESPTIRATPSKSLEPSTKAPINSFSLSPATSPIIIDIIKNNEASSVNHHQRVGIAVIPISSKGITP